MMGTYHRRILLDSHLSDEGDVPGGFVVAELEDDFHRFGATIHHDGSVVTAVEGRATRAPWTTCASALDVLTVIVGMPLFTRHSEVGRWTRAREHCTHLFDITGLAVVHAGRQLQGQRGGGRRVYDIAIPDRVGTATRPTFMCNGELVLAWDIDGSMILGPAPFEEVALRGSFLSWAEENLDPDTAEAAIAMRRAIDTSIGRGMQEMLDEMENPDPTALTMMEGACFTFQPVNVGRARRNRGMARDFTSAAELLPDDVGAKPGG